MKTFKLTQEQKQLLDEFWETEDKSVLRKFKDSLNDPDIKYWVVCWRIATKSFDSKEDMIREVEEMVNELDKQKRI